MRRTIPLLGILVALLFVAALAAPATATENSPLPPCDKPDANTWVAITDTYDIYPFWLYGPGDQITLTVPSQIASLDYYLSDTISGTARVSDTVSFIVASAHCVAPTPTATPVPTQTPQPTPTVTPVTTTVHYAYLPLTMNGHPRPVPTVWPTTAAQAADLIGGTANRWTLMSDYGWKFELGEVAELTIGQGWFAYTPEYPTTPITGPATFTTTVASIYH